MMKKDNDIFEVKAVRTEVLVKFDVTIHPGGDGLRLLHLAIMTQNVPDNMVLLDLKGNELLLEINDHKMGYVSELNSFMVGVIEKFNVLVEGE